MASTILPESAPACLLRLHIRLEIGDRALHHAGALDDLRQEHSAVAEQLADDFHAVHQRPFDHIEWSGGVQASFLGIVLDEFDDAVYHRECEALGHRRVTPCDVDLALGAAARDGVRKRDEALGCIGPAGEDDVFDVLEQVGRDVLVHGELSGVDDAHVETCVDRVIEERCMHRLAHDVVAAKGE